MIRNQQMCPGGAGTDGCKRATSNMPCNKLNHVGQHHTTSRCVLAARRCAALRCFAPHCAMLRCAAWHGANTGVARTQGVPAGRKGMRKREGLRWPRNPSQQQTRSFQHGKHSDSPAPQGGALHMSLETPLIRSRQHTQAPANRETHPCVAYRTLRDTTR